MTQPTQKQRAALDAALARAERDGIRVTGRGIRKADGARVFAVSSASQPGRWYLVAIEGAQLVCDCAAGQHGRMCKHRGAVRQRLEAERATAAQAAQTEREAARERAILARNDRPFSIFKAE